MKLKVCLIVIIIFSLNIMGAAPKIDGFAQVEEELLNKLDFVENGVKTSYETTCDDLNNIKDAIKKLNANYDIESLDNKIKAEDKFSTIEVTAYHKNLNICIDISIINKDKKISTDSLLKELTLLQGKNYSKQRYFKYVKGKIDNNDQGIDIVNSMSQLKNIDALKICNGYTGLANCRGGQRVNFAVNSYNSGCYVIIGTPVIFITY